MSSCTCQTRLASALIGLCAVLPQAALAAPPSADAVRAVLAAERAAVPKWYWGWTAVFSAAATGQMLLTTTTTDPRLADTTRVGAISSTLGVVGMGLTQVRPDLLADPALDDAAAWQALRMQARSEAQGQALVNHALGAAVAVGGGLWLTFHEDRPLEGLLNTLVSFGVSQLQLRTQPTKALKAWRRWQPGVEP
jgi:hypothetical protein